VFKFEKRDPGWLFCPDMLLLLSLLPLISAANDPIWKPLETQLQAWRFTENFALVVGNASNASSLPF
jgi:hypothetical protein